MLGLLGEMAYMAKQRKVTPDPVYDKNYARDVTNSTETMMDESIPSIVYVRITKASKKS